jgi:hypothetical protein
MVDPRSEIRRKRGAARAISVLLEFRNLGPFLLFAEMETEKKGGGYRDDHQQRLEKVLHESTFPPLF